MSTTVIVTGANGYIAQHVVKQLIENNYTVVGTVRTADKGEQLKKNLASPNFSYELIPQIEKKGAFDELLKKHTAATVFLHTASPVNMALTDFKNEVLAPAIDGTKNVLAAVKEHAPQIRRLVVTSSVVAGMPFGETEFVTMDETSWSSVTLEQALENETNAYRGSKKFAEKAAWEFVDSQKPNFGLSVINPSYVFGPQAFDESVKGTLNFSAEFVNQLLKLKHDDELPELASHWVDVRDVARAHLLAFEQDNTRGERLILSSSLFTNQAALNLIRKHFPQLRDTLPVGSADEGYDKLTWDINNDKTKRILGFKFIGFEKSVVDTVGQIVAVNGLQVIV